jgi:hypothetical protein
MVILLGCTAVAIVYREMKLGRFANFSGVFMSLVYLTIAVGLARSALIGFTLIYQWHGRDYHAFDAQLRKLIARDAKVIGPQSIWYALAEQDDLWLYTQGEGRFAEVTGEHEMNDPRKLTDISYIVLDENQTANRLKGLQDYTRANFHIVAKVSPAFAPLPWAKTPALDVEIYERNR